MENDSLLVFESDAKMKNGNMRLVNENVEQGTYSQNLQRYPAHRRRQRQPRRRQRRWKGARM